MTEELKAVSAAKLDIDVDSLNQHVSQLESMAAMLSLYHEAASRGDIDQLGDDTVGNYIWRMGDSIGELKRVIEETTDLVLSQ